MKTKVYYSIVNGGDGSAIPEFFLSERVAELHQEAESLSDGWGEPCYGLAITISSEAPIKIDGMLTTKEVIKDFQERLDDGFYGDGPQPELKQIISKLKNLE